ncbi:ABC transporter permease [Dictyobacter arantiisoli]|uniref:ABC transporter permease n=1 Tax=Dictyobacter arantiisoli TaxID=2014874 RepID=A0A5A5T998_9CHLR|nr:ABC transporter permease subunit [Dictyobacter arantiisoli]GCF08071.1 ABC transporter permease [Dictyobacter arantiisoli]
MAQIFIPENVQEREQLQGGSHSPNENRSPHSEPSQRRRLGLIDLVIALVVIALISLVVVAASRWTAPLTSSIKIDLAPTALPVYAGYSLLRMLLAYLLSLIFTLVYGHVAATSRRASVVMVPLLDILQSIPILSFLPGVVLALVAAFPHSNVGLELSSVILIFTSQAWNMTFSYYHSARSVPQDLQEFSTVARLRPWQHLFKLEIPASMIGLIWNSMMSWAGGWFFLMASEQFVLGSRSFQLPGLGSYLQAAANKGNASALVLGLATLIALIILLDFFFWRPLVAWADKFKLEMNSEGDAPSSPVLNIIRRSALIAAMTTRIFRPIGASIAFLLNRMQPLPGEAHLVAAHKGQSQHTSWFSLRRIVSSVFGLLVLVLLVFGLWYMVRLLGGVSLATWGQLVLAAGATLLRTLVALLIGVVWTVPVGVMIGTSPKWSKRLQPVVQVIASIPATALFPILLVALIDLPGGLSLAAILLMLLGTQWYILFNVIAGAMSIPSDLKEASTIYHVTRWRRWRTLILPAIFPYLVTGLLTASGGAWNASIVSEYVTFNNRTVSTQGLGAAIASAGAAGNFSVLLAGTLLMAFVVVLLNRVLWKRLYDLAERRYTLS